MDEWTSDSLSCEDAKRLLQGIIILVMLFCSIVVAIVCSFINAILSIRFQLEMRFAFTVIESVFSLGGMIVVPQKHRGSVTSHYNSGFFITTNNYPDFGGGRDGEAIKRRLCVFDTKALKRKDASVSGKLNDKHLNLSIEIYEFPFPEVLKQTDGELYINDKNYFPCIL